MLYKQTTQVPNFLFDAFLPVLTEAELKVLLIVIRQTIGWLDKRTGQRKLRDRITSYQFRQKTGLSKRVISTTIQSLLQKNLVQVTAPNGIMLHLAHERKGKTNLFYSIGNPMHITTQTSALNKPEPVQNVYHNKTNYPKLTESKPRPRFTGHISKVLSQKETLFDFRKN
jgi:hypothetical protein